MSFGIRKEHIMSHNHPKIVIFTTKEKEDKTATFVTERQLSLSSTAKPPAGDHS